MNDQSRQYQQLIAKCWADEAFKQRLLSNPAETLKDEGLEVPEGVQVQVLENTAQVLNLVIPSRPTELSDEELHASGLAGGCGDSTTCGFYEGCFTFGYTRTF
ncbi:MULTISPECIES: NHLP leader peptide family RiPP precursor [Thiorhodovibrio]|uniref:NHLP leader peptide family RiPP precursor n=1 Tax=Thiorhodovibrio TaxID=61593 RepID=UPI001911DD97|nr:MULTISPECIES: NHLP leader peptide family RiPP precursor [Thiorhodovibrio]MBK5970282.1 NHLP leader peptide family natural product precursor [Thiorhodovibrio winogradskyi]WPL14851.1 NHLP leader peptide domain protein [Thiorhodovibrio litoralis]